MNTLVRVAVLGSVTACAATPVAAGDEAVERLAGAALTRGGASRFLERLTDTIGGRVTGSSEARAAEDLLLATLKEAGLANVHFEEWTLRSRWRRGTAKGQVVRPVERPLLIGSHGWAPGTSGPVEAPLVDLGLVDEAKLAAPIDGIRGAAVIADVKRIGAEPAFMFRTRAARKLADAGAVALLVTTDKPGRQLDVSCFGNFPKAALPMLSVAREDALYVRRLLAKGPVRVGLDVENRLDMTPSVERNVIAELPGREKPDEIVIVGGHLDSWDTGQGAEDDGSGVAAIVEAARIIQSLGVRPRRTLRFVFWSGEEQAILGSQAYVRAHQAELDNVRAVLIMDSGSGQPRGFEAHGRTDLEAALRKALAPLAAIGADGVSQEASFDQDHAYFLAAGVPAFTLWVDEGGYPALHHAITDTFDKVDPRLLALNTAVMAVAAWSIADSETPLGPRLSHQEAMALLKTTGLESTYRMTFEPQ